MDDNAKSNPASGPAVETSQEPAAQEPPQNNEPPQGPMTLDKPWPGTGPVTNRRKTITVSMDVWLEMAARTKSRQTFDSFLRGLFGMPESNRRPYRGTTAGRGLRSATAVKPPTMVEIIGVRALEPGQSSEVPLNFQGGDGIVRTLKGHSIRVWVSRYGKKAGRKFTVRETEGFVTVTRNS